MIEMNASSSYHLFLKTHSLVLTESSPMEICPSKLAFLPLTFKAAKITFNLSNILKSMDSSNVLGASK